jgi:hypothetical protein
MRMRGGHKLVKLSSALWAEAIRSKISDPTIQIVVANAVWWDCFGDSTGPHPEMNYFVEIWRNWQLDGTAKKKSDAVKYAELFKAYRDVGYELADAKQRAKSFCSRKYEARAEPQIKTEWKDDDDKP